MNDAPGLVQFMSAIGEIARGWSAPSILPVWERHLLNALDPPRVTFTHREYEEVEDTKDTIFSTEGLVQQWFFFGPSDIAALRSQLPPHLRQCSKFEILTACIWKCRTIAIQADPNKEVRMVCIVGARSKLSPQFPKGYYGNCFATPVAIAIARKLAQNPLGYALELIRKTKASVTEEYIMSTIDYLVSRGMPPLALARALIISDLTHSGFMEVDFGWGKADYGGPPILTLPFLSFYIRAKNKKGEIGNLLPMCLSALEMERFAKELDAMLKGKSSVGGDETVPKFITSTM